MIIRKSKNILLKIIEIYFLFLQKNLKGWCTNPRILSFDIETYSDNHYAMPDREKNPDHVIFMISCLYQVTNDISTRKKYVILTEKCKEIPDAELIYAEDEEDLLIKFQDLIDILDPEIILGIIFMDTIILI